MLWLMQRPISQSWIDPEGLTHVGVGLGHEGEEEAEGVADGAVGGARRGLDGAEERGVDGGGCGGGGAVDEGRDGGVRRRGGGGGARALLRRRRPAGGTRHRGGFVAWRGVAESRALI